MNATFQKCQVCGAEVPVNPGYTVWCDKCNWNIDPADSHKSQGLFEKFNNVLGKKLSQRLFQAISSQEDIKPRISILTIVAFLLSMLVYLTNYSIVLIFSYFAVFLMRANLDIVGFFFGGLLLLFAFILLPKYRKDNYELVSRNDYPTLYKIADRISVAMRGKKIDGILINGQFNAYFLQKGIKRKKIIGIGLPLFCILDQQEKIALLAHEIAHSINNDVKRGIFIGGALNLMATWYSFISPEYDTLIYEGGFFGIIIQLIRVMLSKIIIIYWYILSFLLWQDSQRSEYYADMLASSVSGTRPMLTMLDKLHFHNTFYDCIERAAKYSYIKDIFTEFKSNTDNVPSREIERFRRLDELQLSSIDASHPPTTYRTNLLSKFAYESKILIDEFDAKALEDELNCFKSLVQTKLLIKVKSYLGME